jgi:hypothetical protein
MAQLVRKTGVRFADFARAYPPATRSGRPFDPARTEDAPPYVAMETPDGEYYVGLDSPSALHPQSERSNGHPEHLEEPLGRRRARSTRAW